MFKIHGLKIKGKSSAVGMKRVHLGDEMSKATKRDLLELKKCIVCEQYPSQIFRGILPIFILFENALNFFVVAR
jgi:hypothetical protein